MPHPLLRPTSPAHLRPQRKVTLLRNSSRSCPRRGTPIPYRGCPSCTGCTPAARLCCLPPSLPRHLGPVIRCLGCSRSLSNSEDLQGEDLVVATPAVPSRPHEMSQATSRTLTTHQESESEPAVKRPSPRTQPSYPRSTSFVP